MSAVIVGREISISALREWMAELGERARVRVANVGKIKTIVQIISIVVLLYQKDLDGVGLFHVGEVLLGRRRGADDLVGLRLPARRVAGPAHGTIDTRVAICAASRIMRRPRAGIAQLVEHDLAKVGVASSSLVSRSKLFAISRNLGSVRGFVFHGLGPEPRFCFSGA